jgi:hypothetical protein
MPDPDLPAIVRARLVEAAEVERRMHVHGLRPAQPRTLMPAVDPPTFWERVRARADAAEISRAEEAVSWVIRFVADANRRRALWAWARMQAGGLALSRWARREGLQPDTAKVRAYRAIADVVRGLSGFPNVSDLWTDIPEDGLFRNTAERGIDFGIMASGDDADARGRHVTAWMAPDARPQHSDDPDVVKDRARATLEHNERMRRLRELRLAKIEREAA